jgi:prophage regulatory protein
MSSHVTIVVWMDGERIRLVGAHEIRDLLGVSRQRVYQLAARSDFPQPVATLAQGKIWSLSDVEAWIGTHRAGGRDKPAPAAAAGSGAAPPVGHSVRTP